ncbi:polysaccharide biosynthesis protein [Bacillus sp. BRMEA1]|uniref:putative polysaccharide biosynthesis protein n=1 Tax=Neobacillus endophyticus TaxID=2738405 RepID=UPI0015673ED3|nr:polysaccharide biosynthesis protein [Neobacillus endophyticus]NRD77475.1 polysaccharide biosynthesis protein [Neobacillus endophyticus]
MEHVNPSKALFKGAFILTIAGLITKILSAFYRIPFQNIVGDTGFYIYQQIYPFYAIAVVLSTTGFPVVISKLYAEQKEKQNEQKSRILLIVSYLYLQVFGCLCFLVLYFGADQLARWMNDTHLAVLIKVVSLVFLTSPIVSTIRGYYQGIGEMAPTALSQVAEQSIRVLTIIFFSYFFMQKGYSLYIVAGGAMFGSITGSIVACIILFMFLSIRAEWKLITPNKRMLKRAFPDVRRMAMELTFQGLTICLSGMLMIFMQMADSLNLYSLLTANGIEKELAKGLKGIFDRGQPLIQLGTVAATSMSLSLVPLITRERMAANSTFLHDKIQLALKVSVVIGLGASAGLWAVIKPTNIMLFKDASGSDVLGVLGFVILFASMIATVTAIMQGLGHLTIPALAAAAVFPIKYILNMMFIPKYLTMGAAASSLAALLVVTVFLLWRLKRIVRIPLFPARFFEIVLVATIVMVLFLKGYLYLVGGCIHTMELGRLGAAAEALSAVCLGGILFLLIIIRGRVFSAEDLSLFPFGSKFNYFLSRKDRTE